MSITVCPCCGWAGYKVPPSNEDDAVMSCKWCTVNLGGENNLCDRAQDIANRRANENRSDATATKA